MWEDDFPDGNGVFYICVEILVKLNLKPCGLKLREGGEGGEGGKGALLEEEGGRGREFPPPLHLSVHFPCSTTGWQPSPPAVLNF